MYQYSTVTGFDPGLTLLGVDGTSGPDTLTASYYGSTLLGGGGDDRLIGSSYGDYLDGGDGADTLSGGGGNDTMLGGAGNDVFDIKEDAQARLTLGAGADLIRISGFQTRESEVSSVLDFTWNEDGIRFAYLFGSDYGEGSAASFAEARSLSQRLGLGGYDIVSIQVGADVIVFGNWSTTQFQSAIRLVNRTLDDIAGANVGLFSAPTVNEPTAPAAPFRATAGSIVMAGNMDSFDVAVLRPKNIEEVSGTRIVLDGPGLDIILTGPNFGTDASRTQLLGQVTGVALGAGPLQINATNLAGRELAGVITGIDAKETVTFVNYLMVGSDAISGSAGGDLIRAGFGNDIIRGQGGSDTIFAGGGDDVIYAVAPGVGAGAGSTYLRGDEGADWIMGGDGFDDINGNEGIDTLLGGLGDDWVVGGKQGDRLFGEAGNDIVYGNLGNDFCVGGEGNDTVRGGQDDDQVFGGAGADFLSGDKGNDTMVGGAGADIFHSFVGADTDRIMDFNFAEGDRVMVPIGTQWTLEQLGPDLIVNLVGGGRIVMVGLTQTNLPNGWIFAG